MNPDKKFSFIENGITYNVSFHEELHIEAVYHEDYTEWSSLVSDNYTDEQSSDESSDESSDGIREREPMVAKIELLHDSKLNIHYNPERKYQILLDHKNKTLKKSITIIFPEHNKQKITNLCIEIITKIPYVNDNRNLIIIKPRMLSPTDRIKKTFEYHREKLENKIIELEKRNTDMESKLNAQQQQIESILKTMNK